MEENKLTQMQKVLLLTTIVSIKRAVVKERWNDDLFISCEEIKLIIKEYDYRHIKKSEIKKEWDLLLFHYQKVKKKFILNEKTQNALKEISEILS